MDNRWFIPWLIGLAILVTLVGLTWGRSQHFGLRRPIEPNATTTPSATSTNTPTSTSTATATSTSTATRVTPPTVAPTSERVRVTWYGEAHRGGLLYCGTDIYGRYDPDDPTTVATGASGPPCGSKLRLCSEDACIVVTVKDRCGGCGLGHLDLSRAAWNALGQPSTVNMAILGPLISEVK